MTEKEKDILNRFGNYLQTNEYSTEFLVEYIKLIGSFLNIQTIPDCAKSNKLSYPGVLKSNRFNKIELFNTKFIIESI